MSVHMLSKNEEQWIRRRAAEGTNISKKDRDLLEYYGAVRASGGDPGLKGRRASNAWGPHRGVSAPLGHYLRDVPALEAGYAGWMGLSPMQRGLVTPVRIRGYTPLHTRPAGNPLTVQEAPVFNEIQENKAPKDTWRTPIHDLAPVGRESVLMEGVDFDSPKVVKKRMTELDAKGGTAMGHEDMREAARDRRIRWEREFEDWLSADGGQAVHAAQDAGKTARRGVLVPEKKSRPMVWGYVTPDNKKVFYFPHLEESLRNADYLAHAIDGAPRPGSGDLFQLLTDHTYGAYAPWHFRKFSGERGQTFLNNMTKAFAEAAKTASPTGGVVRVPSFSPRGGTFVFPYSRLITEEIPPGRRAWMEWSAPFKGSALDTSGEPYEEHQPRGITLRQMDAKGGRTARAAMAAGKTDEDEFARADRERKAAERDQLDRELVAFNDAIGKSGTGTVDGRPVRFRAMPTREQYERYREVNGGFSPDSRYFQDLGIELPGGAVNPAFEFSPSSRHPTSILDDPEGLERNRMTNGSMPASSDGTLVDRSTFGPRVDPRLQSTEEMRRRRRERDERIFDALYGTTAAAKGGRTARR